MTLADYCVRGNDTFIVVRQSEISSFPAKVVQLGKIPLYLATALAAGILSEERDLLAWHVDYLVLSDSNGMDIVQNLIKMS